VKPLPTSIQEEETHQGKGRTSEDLEGDKQPPAPDQELESNWTLQEHV